MKDFTVTNHSLEQYISNLQDELEKTPVIIVTTQDGNTGKWGMARLFRSWMATTAQVMAGNGVTMPLMIGANGENYGKRRFNKDDAHELFTSQHLGVDADGVRLSWAKKDHDGMRAATKGERFNALFKHEHWCLDKGIILFKPRGSEYDELERKQNE